ncbi:hypothetical protein BZA05DRAFT_397902 [Tricharina praecox]|uniref:uncharacterized protein n=1 Tax=Tricharina praecox TaxID=43433 RepID=UPI002220A654|nr:uncharacterized protein BZA05DRAFT_397902 [Tricharina praecox]KAI5851815.1 hypothetical protein BZA05DRAFT_397902 [Tricharina praecox]
MTQPPKHKRLSCRREKNACYSILILLFLLSGCLFGISFLPNLRGSSTRVYLWVLSSSTFIITSTVVLFLVSFCASCRGCRASDSEEAAGNEMVGENKDRSARNSLSSSHRSGQTVNTGSSSTYNKRPSTDTTLGDRDGPATLFRIDEESVTCTQTSTLAPLEAIYYAGPEYTGRSPYSGSHHWPAYSRPCPSPRLPATITCVSLPEDESLWKFERNWTEWNGGSATDSTEAATETVVEATDTSVSLPSTDTETKMDTDASVPSLPTETEAKMDIVTSVPSPLTDTETKMDTNTETKMDIQTFVPLPPIDTEMKIDMDTDKVLV